MIDIAKPSNGDPTGLSDLLIGALGLSGLLVLVGVVLAVVLAVGLFLWRSRVGLNVNPEETRDQHIV